MPSTAGFDCFPLTFDADGALKTGKELDALVAKATVASATDIVFIAHGFRNDEQDATSLYTRFLQTLRQNLSRPELANVAQRKFVVATVYWPSKPFREQADGTRSIGEPKRAMAQVKTQLRDLKAGATKAEKAKLDKAIALLPRLDKSTKAQDGFVKLVLSLVDDSDRDRTEGLPQLRKRKGSELLARLGSADGTRGLGDIVSSIGGGVGQFLNMALWYVMKERSGTVGATGVAKAVRDVHAALPTIRIHLVGHSLGGRLMASCAKELCRSPKVRPDSLTLLEAAFSHFGFSPDNGRGKAGFFRDIVTKQLVKGPFLSTFSAEDTVVGKAYSIVSRLAKDNTREIGDANDEFGGIGRNGPLRTVEVAHSRLRAPGTRYAYQLNVINNLDGSGGLIKNHGDVANEAVTYAFASAVALT